MAECDIKITDTALSRQQCEIRYTNDSSCNWILFDGPGKGTAAGEKRSTNGTWLYVDDYFRIYDGMVFRACNCLFESSMTEPDR